MSFYFAFPQASVAIRRCPLERWLIVACMRMLSLVNVPVCTGAFTVVNYKRQSEHTVPTSECACLVKP